MARMEVPVGFLIAAGWSLVPQRDLPDAVLRRAHLAHADLHHVLGHRCPCGSEASDRRGGGVGSKLEKGLVSSGEMSLVCGVV